MPHDLPHWRTCYHYFRLWTNQRQWERMHSAIQDLAHVKLCKENRPLRYSIAKAFGQLANPVYVALMRIARLQEEACTSW